MVKSSLQVLRSLMYTLVKRESEKLYKSVIIHKREIIIHNIKDH